MRRLLVVLAMFGLFGATACTSVKPLEISNSPIGADVAGDAGPVIERALADRGWQVVDRAPGTIDATILVRQHRADIRITYTERSYSIGYRGSENLYATKRGRIHRNYNRWIANLDRSIQRGLARHAQPGTGS